MITPPTIRGYKILGIVLGMILDISVGKFLKENMQELKYIQESKYMQGRGESGCSAHPEVRQGCRRRNRW